VQLAVMHGSQRHMERPPAGSATCALRRSDILAQLALMT
jgi:hypothetical protein